MSLLLGLLLLLGRVLLKLGLLVGADGTVSEADPNAHHQLGARAACVHLLLLLLLLLAQRSVVDVVVVVLVWCRRRGGPTPRRGHAALALALQLT